MAEIPAPSSDEKANDVFPFEKLPPELRERVYVAVLVCDTIRVTRNHEKSRRLKNTEKAQMIVAKAIAVNSAGKEVTLRRFLPKQGTSILRINRATYKEALPILYGNNKFIFYSLPALGQLVEESPTGMNLLRHVVILANGLESFAPAMRNLQDIENLRTMVVRLGKAGAFPNRINTFIPAICAFIERKDTQDERKSELQKISFAVDGDWARSFPFEVSSADLPALYKGELQRRLLDPNKEFSMADYTKDMPRIDPPYP